MAESQAGTGGIVAGQKKAPPKPGKTGRYVICPWSNTPGVHGLVAKQIERSEKGNLWFKCVCGFRGYAPKFHPLPKATKKDMLAAGAIIPDEMMDNTRAGI